MRASIETKTKEGLMMANHVFIACSLDGYIADSSGSIDWLAPFNSEDQLEMFTTFISQIDAILMGRNTFEKVLSFNIPWPYNKPVFVMSRTLDSIPDALSDKVFLIDKTWIMQGVAAVEKGLANKGFNHLYIDGGMTIRSFLAEEKIDSMQITYVPVILGQGIALFEGAPPSSWRLKDSKGWKNGLVTLHYAR